jgi:hypothetical protein
VPLAFPDEGAAILVAAAGFAPAAARVPPQPAGEPIEVRLELYSAIDGDLLGASGKPVAGARVFALARSAPRSTSAGFPPHAPRSDALGKFRLGGLMPGKYDVFVAASGRTSATRVPATVLGASTTLPIKLPPLCDRCTDVQPVVAAQGRDGFPIGGLDVAIR